MSNFKAIDLKLCHSCGTCVAACPVKAITLNNTGLPQLTAACTDCGLCFKACPGIAFNYPEFNRHIFAADNTDKELGYYLSVWAGHSNNPLIRDRAASGGIATALVSGLFKRGLISAAILVGMDNNKPWAVKANLVRSESEVKSCAQSKYSMVSLNQVLADVASNDINVAMVGLPCHIHGVRKLESLGWPGIDKIKYRIGLFCGFNMKSEATNFLIDKFRVKKDDIESIEYRAGARPGNFRIRTKDGRSYQIDKHSYNYLNLMYVPKRCLVCPDLTNEFADISLGDAWMNNSGKRSNTLVIVRTPKGDELLQQAVSCADIEISPVDKDAVWKSHAQLIVYKKRGIAIRERLTGLKPDFHLDRPILSAKEKVFNYLFFYLIFIMSSPFTTGLFKYMPLAVSSFISRQSRIMLNFIFRNGKEKNEQK